VEVFKKRGESWIGGKKFKTRQQKRKKGEAQWAWYQPEKKGEKTGFEKKKRSGRNFGGRQKRKHGKKEKRRYRTNRKLKKKKRASRYQC